ncbi:MAG: HEAT repeat domain-containing protein [Halobacteriota archaeon]
MKDKDKDVRERVTEALGKMGEPAVDSLIQNLNDDDPIVRMEDIRSNSLFYLAGTMINVTYSVIVGVILKVLITTF